MKDQSNYISYLPMLLKTVEASGNKPILELGMGFSTVVLHMLCKLSKREIVSYETDSIWYNKNLVYNTDWHKILFVSNWDNEDITSTDWGVVLVDHRPAMRRRTEALRVRDNADFILLHDSEPEIDRFYRYSSIYSQFKYRYDDTKVKPNTTVLSNTKELSFLT